MATEPLDINWVNGQQPHFERTFDTPAPKGYLCGDLRIIGGLRPWKKEPEPLPPEVSQQDIGFTEGSAGIMLDVDGAVETQSFRVDEGEVGYSHIGEDDNKGFLERRFNVCIPISTPNVQSRVSVTLNKLFSNTFSGGGRASFTHFNFLGHWISPNAADVVSNEDAPGES